MGRERLWRYLARLACALSLMAVIPACTSQETRLTYPGTTVPAPTVLPTLTDTPKPVVSPETPALQTPTSSPIHPVILISWDGAPADDIDALQARGELPHFSRLASAGVRAGFARSIYPSLTAPAHASIATGALPDRTGIVANIYHNPNDNFYWYRRGFEEPIDGLEPVWVTASRNGLKTAAVFFPGATPEIPTQVADYTIGYGIREAYSRQVSLEWQEAGEWINAPISYSPLQEAEYQIPKVARLYLLAVDTKDDALQEYDQVYISAGSRDAAHARRLGVGDWGAVTILPHTHSGADFLLQELNTEKVTLYHTGVYRNTATPRRLLEELNRRFGYFRSGADAYALEHGWITPEDYLYLLEQSSLWMADVTRWVYATYKPDLLFTWQSVFDDAGHAFYLRDPRQPGYSAELAAQYADYYRIAAQVADNALGIMLADIDLQDATVLLVSDHGMAPMHTTVYVNTVLEQAGYLVLDERNYLVVEQSQAYALASGGTVNVYINLENREKSGIVSPEAYTSVQAQVIELLSSLKDPLTGEAVFQIVLPSTELYNLGLDHQHAGDIFAIAYPGYNLDSWRGREEVFGTPHFYGQHGYDRDLPAMAGIFIAAGYGARERNVSIPPVSVLDYAPTIATLLQFPLAAQVDGEAILHLGLP